MDKKDPKRERFYKKIKEGSTGKELVFLALSIFDFEQFMDSGVQMTYSSLKKQPPLLTMREKAEFLLSLRKRIATQGVNSHFTELAINGLWRALSVETGRTQEFLIQYVKEIIDNLIVQELPDVIGTVGLVNLYSFTNKMQEVENYLRELIVQNQVQSPQELIDIILA
jgi:hypothetical protein